MGEAWRLTPTTVFWDVYSLLCPGGRAPLCPHTGALLVSSWLCELRP